MLLLPTAATRDMRPCTLADTYYCFRVTRCLYLQARPRHRVFGTLVPIYQIARHHTSYDHGLTVMGTLMLILLLDISLSVHTFSSIITFFLSGVRLSTLGPAATIGLLYQPQMMMVIVEQSVE
jgi:hypothetical protein